MTETPKYTALTPLAEFLMGYWKTLAEGLAIAFLEMITPIERPGVVLHRSSPWVIRRSRQSYWQHLGQFALARLVQPPPLQTRFEGIQLGFAEGALQSQQGFRSSRLQINRL